MKVWIVLFLLCVTFCGKTQQSKKIESLDSFFGGFPLRKGFNAWVDFMASDPHLGIDSIGERGGYTSFKPGIKSHFPFPDSVFVKILLSKDINPRTGDTAIALSIEGVFGNNKKAKKASEIFYHN